MKPDRCRTRYVRIAVVICRWRRRRPARAACCVAANLAGRDFVERVIVVDNDSTDGSIDYAEPMFPRSVRWTRFGAAVAGISAPPIPGFLSDALEKGGRIHILCLNPTLTLS